MSRSKNKKKESLELWLDFQEYVTPYRFSSYWHQIDEVLKSEPGSILEIGVGPRVTSSYLVHQNFSIMTLDLEYRLSPDIVGSVIGLPFKNRSFDTVLCCQVMEHLAFEKFRDGLNEMKIICKKKLILSLPDKTPALSLIMRVPNFIFWDFLLNFPFAVREPIRSSKEHQWEIGRWGYSYKRILKEIESTGFSVERTYRVKAYPYHRFFILVPWQ